jgi:hypothetical protein
MPAGVGCQQQDPMLKDTGEDFQPPPASARERQSRFVPSSRQGRRIGDARIPHEIGVTRGLTAGADPAVMIKSTHLRAIDGLSWCRWRARRLPSLVTAWCPVPSAIGFGSARTRAALRRDCPSPRVTASVPDRLFRDRARPRESPRRAESPRPVHHWRPLIAISSWSARTSVAEAPCFGAPVLFRENAEAAARQASGHLRIRNAVKQVVSFARQPSILRVYWRWDEAKDVTVSRHARGLARRQADHAEGAGQASILPA